MSKNSSQTLFEDFGDLVKDTLCALVTDPEKITVVVHSCPSAEGELIVDIVAPYEQIAMIIGKRAETVQALHRVFLCQARNWGLATSVRLSWDPSDG